MPMKGTVRSEAQPAFSTLVELLRFRAENQPDRCAYTFLEDGESVTGSLTYSELDRKARRVAAFLQAQGAANERALLLFPPGLEFIAAYFGCLYAGTIAVPAFPPRRNRPIPRILSIAQDSGARFALTTREVYADIEKRLEHAPILAGLRWQTTDTLDDSLATAWRFPSIESHSLAFLQYTSGSTASPKGVMVSHANLLHNLDYLYRMEANTPECVAGTWLPPFHDMGLIEGLLQPLFGGFPCYFMPPMAFLQRPIRWLRLITRYRITNSGAPNFAYDLCVQKIPPEQREGLDLRSWTFAFNGAEPIRKTTLDQFAKAFAPYGFRHEFFCPGYGLAEATLAVALNGRQKSAKFMAVMAGELEQHRIIEVDADDESGRQLVASGCFDPEFMEVAIIHPETRRTCRPGEVGEIWVRSPSVAQGYWNRPEETAETFRAVRADTGEGPYLRTGDLGFIDDGHLFITGRLKDLIIIAGRNFYPQDIELVAEQSHPGVRANCSAAFSHDENGIERLIVVCELEREAMRKVEPREIEAAIRQAVASEHDVRVHRVYLLRPGSIPKTTSGKIQRRLCRKLLLEGELPAVYPARESRKTRMSEPVSS